MNCDISTVKILTGKVVLSAVIARIEWILKHFHQYACLFPVVRIPLCFSILWQMWPAGKTSILSIIH